MGALGGDDELGGLELDLVVTTTAARFEFE
jgi:hypothetical protein